MATTQQSAAKHATVEPKALVESAGDSTGVEAGTEPTLEFKPTDEVPHFDPLAGLAVDANELAWRIHDGQGTDLDDLIDRSLHDRAA